MSLPERNDLHIHVVSDAQPSIKDERLRETVPYLVPQSKLKKVSKLEKVVFCTIVATFLFLSIATIKMTTAINREEEAITSVQQEINTSTRAIDKLEQEKNELLRSDRIKEIAEKADIEMRDDNIRKIK